MNLFLDTSVLLAACGSKEGASHHILEWAPKQAWTLFVSPYVIEEALRNLPLLGTEASTRWARYRRGLRIVDDVLTSDRPTVFAVAKDRPVLFTAMAWADVLLTLDRAHFERAVGRHFYGLTICTPGEFLRAERASGRLVD
jgi:predicted nucleic acid-binding protein